MLRLFTFGGLRLEGPEGPVAGAAARRRSLALLALIAAAGPRGITRERIAGILWADSTDELAKRVLAQSLYALRKALDGDDIILNGGALRLDPARITSDVEQFNAALEVGDRSAAIAAYSGPFLDGFYLSGAPGFERWTDDERARLAGLYRGAVEREAIVAETSGELSQAIELWRKLASSDPLAARPLTRLVNALDASGDRPAALRQLRIHVALLEQEGIAPSAEVAGLERSLSEPAPSPSARPRVAAAAPVPTAASVVPSAPAAPDRIAKRPRSLAAFVIGGAFIAAVVATIVVRAAGARTAPIIAVGLIESHVSNDSAGLARALPDLVTTQLTHVPGLSVVSRARLFEVLGEEARVPGPGTLTRAARLAGATEIIEGALYRDGEDGVRLDLRRVSLKSGALREAVSVTADNPATLVERGVAAVATSLGLPIPVQRLAAVTSLSLVARRFYEEGLRWFYADDAPTAARLFSAALAEDPGFAMAAFYLAMCPDVVGDSVNARWRLATELAPRATDRERLLILSIAAARLDDARMFAFAETLSVRYPEELEGKLVLGDQRYARGEFNEAVAAFVAVVRADEAGRTGQARRCHACDALPRAVWASLAADSLDAAERLVREMISWNPQVSGPYDLLGTVLLRQEDIAGARAAFRRRYELSGGDASLRDIEVLWAQRTGDFATLDSVVQRLVSAPRNVGELLYGFARQSELFRETGRLDAALTAARRHRRLADSLSGGVSGDPFVRLPEALALLELGRTDPTSARAAADLFNRMSAMPAYPEARMPRHRVWMWTHQATALALAGDTAELPALERRIEEMASRSAHGRDWLMPHYVEGLMFEARGDWSRAADAYRQAIWSPAENHVAPRLARALIETERPAEAIAVLQPWLRGPIDAANQYVTRAEGHRLLADAFLEVGRPDSAGVHYGWVSRAQEVGKQADHP